MGAKEIRPSPETYKMADRFEVRIQWSDADEAARQIRDAIAGNIEIAREFGDPIPKKLFRNYPISRLRLCGNE